VVAHAFWGMVIRDQRGQKMGKFVEPKLDPDLIEFRYVDGEVSLYFNKEGLERLIEVMKGVADKSPNHIHLQDYEILSPNSLPAVLGFFDKQ
jgi:hypothetical protein